MTPRDILLSLIRMSVDEAALRSWRPSVLPYCEDLERLLLRRRLASVPYLGEARVPPRIGWERWLWQTQRKHLNELVAAASAHGLELFVVKGAEMCERFFGSQPLGKKGDVDLIVRKEDELEVRRLLGELGFIQANFDAAHMALAPCTEEELLRHESNSYNLKSFAKLVELDLKDAQELSDIARLRYPFFADAERAIALVIIDVSFGFDRSIEMPPILARSIPSAFAGASTLSLEDHLWHLCSQFYLKSFLLKEEVKLSLLCEIAAILWNGRASLDWSYLAMLCRKYDLYPYIYYNVAFLDQLLELGLGGVLEMFDPRQGGRQRDFGWLVNRAFGELDPFPASLIESVSRLKKGGGGACLTEDSQAAGVGHAGPALLDAQ